MNINIYITVSIFCIASGIYDVLDSAAHEVELQMNVLDEGDRKK